MYVYQYPKFQYGANPKLKKASHEDMKASSTTLGKQHLSKELQKYNCSLIICALELDM
jgi:hypothetical protein